MLFEIKSPVNGYPKDFLLSVNWMVFPHNWNDVGTAVMSWQLKHITSVLFTLQFITILHFPVHLQWHQELFRDRISIHSGPFQLLLLFHHQE